MDIVSVLAIYFVTWWLCWYAVLLLGDRSPPENPEIGHDPGAPEQAMPLKKMLMINSVLTAVVFAGGYVAITYFGLNLWGGTLD